jgi:molecular chaperone GrpE
MDDRERLTTQESPVEEPDSPDAPARDGAAHAAPSPVPEPGEAAPPMGQAVPEPGDAPHENHEAKLEHDLEELAARAQKADEYLELAQRTKADFENFRKRAARETAAAQERGVVKLARELLPAVDSLDRAVHAASDNSNGDDLAAGIKLVHAELIAALARVGVEPFSPEGERFDPEHHEAVAQHPAEGAQPGTVVEVYQRGYRIGDAVIRPAKVVVAG